MEDRNQPNSRIASRTLLIASVTDRGIDLIERSQMHARGKGGQICAISSRDFLRPPAPMLLVRLAI